MRLCVLAFFFVSLSLGCAPAAVKPPAVRALDSQTLDISEQGLTDFSLKLTGSIPALPNALVEKATFELVIDGKVIDQGVQTISQPTSASEPTVFTVIRQSQYVRDAAELEAMSVRGGSVLAAVRGEVSVKQGESTFSYPFARSREIRVPRLPSVKLQEVEGARYTDKESQITIRLGVVNPNPFPITLRALEYRLELAGKMLSEGKLGAGEKIAKSATDVFDVEVQLNEETFGKEVIGLIKTQKIPYELKGQLVGDLFQIPVEMKGQIKLNTSQK